MNLLAQIIDITYESWITIGYYLCEEYIPYTSWILLNDYIKWMWLIRLVKINCQ